MTPPAADRCPTCDREECPMIGNGGEYAALDLADCRHHRVDWRARALAAEAERSAILALVSPSSDQSLPDAVRELCEQVDDACQWRAALEGVKEPGDPVIRSLAALLTCTYLDRLPTPADDDIRRELVVAARIAHDKTRAAAAQWAKVAPLIEELRRVAHSDDHDMMDVVDAVSPILAATEPTP